MDFTAEGPQALPLWVNGHAYLSMADEFFDVRDRSTGEAIFRVPLYGEAEAAACAQAARDAQTVWGAMGLMARRTCLEALAKALDDLRGHFSRLLMPETGLDLEAAGLEVDAAVAALRGTSVGEGGVLGVIVDAEQPLFSFVRTVAPLLLGGACLVVKPSPRAPSAVFALCELASRHEWPDGVLNVLQGDKAAIEGLCVTDVDGLCFAGDSPLRAQVAAIVERCERALLSA